MEKNDIPPMYLHLPEASANPNQWSHLRAIQRARVCCRLLISACTRERLRGGEAVHSARLECHMAVGPDDGRPPISVGIYMPVRISGDIPVEDRAAAAAGKLGRLLHAELAADNRFPLWSRVAPEEPTAADFIVTVEECP